jgi:DNA-binding ferritin-like protein
MMPEIGGDDLYEMVQEHWPELAERWAFITGGAFTGSAADFLRMTHAVILDKPVTTADLQRTVKELAAKRR